MDELKQEMAETMGEGEIDDIDALEEQLEGDIADDEGQAYTVFVNNPERNGVRRFPSNYVKTSKYTVLTFLPINLFEQFRRFSNVFFFLVAVLAIIPGVTPLFWPTSVTPFLLILFVGGAKDAYEDYMKHVEDRKANRKMFKVVRYYEDGTSAVEDVMSKDIQCGDIICISDKQIFPADIVLLSGSREDGSCYVETSNLDGESNLKSRKALSVTAVSNTPELLNRIEASVQCEDPNEHLYQFKGRLVFETESYEDEEGAYDEDQDPANPQSVPLQADGVGIRSAADGQTVYSLSHKQLLLRGAQLRNTKYIYGVVVYTGVITKLMLNQTGSQSRFSKFDRLLNKVVSSIFVLFALAVIISAILSGIFQEDVGRKMGYLGYVDQPGREYAAISLMTFFILFSYMIPISLFVTMEMVRFAQSNFMQWDVKMWSDPDDPETGMHARNSNINEELGQIEHIFSDKTGTLTQNLMKFVKISVGGTLVDVDALEHMTITPELDTFLKAICLCHSAVPEMDDSLGQMVYNSQSPDEVALLNGAKQCGYEVKSRSSESTVISIKGVDVVYEILAVLEFNANRKRMSVIVREPDGKICLYCKGADSVIFERVFDKDGEPVGDPSGILQEKAMEEDESLRNTNEHLTFMAKAGLRTLVVASSVLEKDTYDEWRVIFEKAEQSITHRAARLAAAYEAVETDMKVLASTAIEDKLQDEVPETIRFFNDAGVTLWLLTGDKQETAVNIGYSAQILSEDMDLIIINVKEQEDCLAVMEQAIAKYGPGFESLDDMPTDGGAVAKFSDGNRKVGLIINGESLDFALSFYANTFVALGSLCDAVICCRVTPGQKALVVRLAKVNLGKICLAIGDGANDVAMIQEANVGIGIMGREGTQAARAADFAIVEFRHLKRLCAVHGRYSYVRMATLVQYSFYKNMAFIIVCLIYASVSGFSGQTAYDSWVMSGFNIVFTSLPPLVIGIFEKDISDVIVEHYPALYTPLKDDLKFCFKTMLGWVFDSVWHGVVFYFATAMIFANGQIFPDGQIGGIWCFATFAASMAVITVLLRCALEVRHWVWLDHLTIWGSIVVFILFNVAYGLTTMFGSNMYNIMTRLIMNPIYLLACYVLVPVVCLLPDITYSYVKRMYYPQPADILQERAVIKRSKSVYLGQAGVAMQAVDDRERGRYIDEDVVQVISSSTPEAALIGDEGEEKLPGQSIDIRATPPPTLPGGAPE